MTQQTGPGAGPAEADGESARPKAAVPRADPDAAPGPDGTRVDLTKARPQQSRKSPQPRKPAGDRERAEERPPEDAEEDVKDGDGVKKSQAAQGVDDGFGSAFCSSMATLCAEAVIGGTVAVFVALAREHDGLPGSAVVIVGAVLALGLVGVLLSGFVTAVAVMPALSLARWWARRKERTDNRWRALAAVPVVSAALVAAFGAVAALGSRALAQPLTYLEWWAALTAALAPATVVARTAGGRARAGRSGRLVRRVARNAAVVWLGIAVLGAAAYGTGLVSVYKPPRLSTSDIEGTWTDGHGGTVELAENGKAVADGLDNFVWDGTGKDKPKDCEGTGTWNPVKESGHVQGVSMRINACELVREWSVGGTAKKPRIFHELGKPGSGKRYVLTKMTKKQAARQEQRKHSGHAGAHQH